MASGTVRAVRLMLILDLLKSMPGGVSVPDLAARFGVSQRTIQADMLILQGEPLYTPLEQVTVWRLVDMRADVDRRGPKVGYQPPASGSGIGQRGQR